jgi:hypothetical protein
MRQKRTYGAEQTSLGRIPDRRSAALLLPSCVAQAGQLHASQQLCVQCDDHG